MKKLVVILLLITVLAILCTAILVVNKLDEVQKRQVSIEKITTSEEKKPDKVINTGKLYKEYHTNVQDDAKGAKLSDSYNENSLVWKYIDNSKGDITCGYYQISGLKDKSIQDSINKRLKESSEKYVSTRESNKDKKDGKARYEQYILSNFGDVISVANFSPDDSYYPYDDFRGKFYIDEAEFINIDLNTGKDLEFEDLFTKDADIINIVSNAFHLNIAGDPYEWHYNEETGEEERIDCTQYYSPEDVELKIEKKIKKFRYDGNIEFGFTPVLAFIKIDGELATINLYNYYDDVAIYNRFISSKSIYEDDSIGLKNINVFCDFNIDNGVACVINEEVSNGVYLTYYMLNTTKSSIEKDFENKEKIIKEVTNTIRNKVNNLAKGKTEEEEIIILGISCLDFISSTNIGKQFISLNDEDHEFYEYVNANINPGINCWALNSNFMVVRGSKEEINKYRLEFLRGIIQEAEVNAFSDSPSLRNLKEFNEWEIAYRTEDFDLFKRIECKSNVDFDIDGFYLIEKNGEFSHTNDFEDYLKKITKVDFNEFKEYYFNYVLSDKNSNVDEIDKYSGKELLVDDYVFDYIATKYIYGPVSDPSIMIFDKNYDRFSSGWSRGISVNLSDAERWFGILSYDMEI